MTPNVPVHIERKKGVVYGECAKCGKRDECAVSDDPEDGSRNARTKLAVKAVLDTLGSMCDEKLPWGLPPAHVERYVPKGLALFAEDVNGKLWALSVDSKGLCSTVLAGCAQHAVIWVIPENDSNALADLAIGYATLLRKKGYKKAQVAPVGYTGKTSVAETPVEQGS